MMLRPEMDIIITKYTALYGTWLLKGRHKKRLEGYFNSRFVYGIERFADFFSITKELEIAKKCECDVFPIAEGGITAALWYFISGFKGGIDVSLEEIPIRQETVEICELLGVSPYELNGIGSVLIATDNASKVLNELHGADIPAKVIGKLTDSNDKILRRADGIRHLDRPAIDSYYRSIDPLYKRKVRIMRKKILSYIEKNSRVDLKELSIMLDINEDELLNELQKMEKESVICGYHTLIDWEKAGEEKVNALIEVSVTLERGQGFDKIAERIYNYPEVSSVYLISGSYDLLVGIEGKSLKEVSSFVSNKLSVLENVLSTKTNFVLKKYKDFGTIMAKPKKDERQKVMI